MIAAIQAGATATANANATATAQAVANANATTTVEAREQWPLVLLGTFNADMGDWYTGEWGNRLGTTRAVIAEGKYRWDVEAKEGHTSRYTPEVRPVSDFLLTVEAQQVSGPSAADYGLVFREDASNYYYFGVNPNTQSFFVSVRYFEKWFTLIRLLRK